MAKLSQIIVVFCVGLVLWCSFVLADHSASKLTVSPWGHARTGGKISIEQQALNYLAQQFKPVIQRQLQHVNVAGLSGKTDTPVGHIHYKVHNIRLTSASLSTPHIDIRHGADDIQVTLHKFHAHMKCDWKYHTGGFIPIKDHGSADADITMKTTMQLRLKIQNGHKFLVHVQSFHAHFTHFDLKLHGGASWLYNIFIKVFKHKIEHNVQHALDKKVPSIVEHSIEKALSKVKLQHHVGASKYNVYVDYSLDQIDYGSNKHPNILSVGTRAEFFRKDSQRYPKYPSPLPNTSGQIKMIEILISEFSLNSFSWAFKQAGVMRYIITNDDIPSKIPFKLNTKFFKPILPKLYSKFPHQDMRINLTAVHSPQIHINNQNGAEMNATGAAIFQVVNGSNIIEAFALNLNLVFDLEFGIRNNNITGSLSYKSVSMSVTDSIIGHIDVSVLDKTIRTLFHYVVVPFTNQYLHRGFPLPKLQGLTLKNPGVVFGNGYMAVSSNFHYHPPF